jgi:beta-catenin-like protein 1
LKTAFAAFMGKGVAAHSSKKATSSTRARETEERAVSVIASLFANLEPGSELHDRLCAKFVEDDHAKIDRLVELWFAYATRVENVQAEQRRSTAPGGILEGADEDELYVERLGGGLYTLELLGCILGAAFATKHAGIRERTLLQMELMSGTDGDLDSDGDAREARLLRPVRDVLETHAENIGDADGEEEQMRRRMRVVKLIVALGGGREEAAGE